MVTDYGIFGILLRKTGNYKFAKAYYIFLTTIYAAVFIMMLYVFLEIRRLGIELDLSLATAMAVLLFGPILFAYTFYTQYELTVLMEKVNLLMNEKKKLGVV